MSIEKNIARIIESMPSMPITVAKILEITRDQNSTANDLNMVITLDPVLTGKVLKLVNSAYYNLSNQVTSIVKAIIMLGINTIRNLAVSTAVLGTMTRRENFVALNMDGYWRHSLAVGVTAKTIAAKMNVDPKLRDEYFIAGLLHDIGKIVMNQHFEDLYLQAIREADATRTSLWSKEAARMGIDHARAGEMIAAHWQLTAPLTEAIALHHRPLEATPENRRLVYAVAVANAFCVESELGFSGDRAGDAIGDEVMAQLNLSFDDLYSFSKSIEEEIARASIFLDIEGKGG